MFAHVLIPARWSETLGGQMLRRLRVAVGAAVAATLGSPPCGAVTPRVLLMDNGGSGMVFPRRDESP